nr:10819_t:CDS:2 [Entrophospora candida]
MVLKADSKTNVPSNIPSDDITYNSVTSFTSSINPIYGVTAEDANHFHEEIKNQWNAYDPYAFKDLTTGDYVTRSTSKQSNDIYTMAIQAIWLCGYKKWNIAFYQRVVTEEYDVILGKPPPGIDMFLHHNIRL